jgi:RHS repeat-associated protein
MLQSAGGIGGLVAIEQVTGSNAGSYACFYDGNGNLGQLIDIATGAVAAKYEYDPYGNNLLDPTDPTESGPYAAGNPIRFSTKHWDDETGLGYWGYRYYSPALGRWLSRDPIAEPGAMLVQRVVVSGAHFLPRDPIHANGPNYYRALRNDPIQRVDPDGGQSISFPGVGPIGPGGPGNWPPGVPYPPIPVPPPPPAQPRTQDLVYLHCYEPVRHTGLYHCDVECLPTSGPPVIGGGTGPESSGGLQGPDICASRHVRVHKTEGREDESDYRERVPVPESVSSHDEQLKRNALDAAALLRRFDEADTDGLGDTTRQVPTAVLRYPGPWLGRQRALSMWHYDAYYGRHSRGGPGQLVRPVPLPSDM